MLAGRGTKFRELPDTRHFPAEEWKIFRLRSALRSEAQEIFHVLLEATFDLFPNRSIVENLFRKSKAKDHYVQS